MYISTVSIRNLRCFGHAEVAFQYPVAESNSTKAPQNVTLLLGDNGAGKTTVLKAVALAILSPVISDSGFRPYYLVRRWPGGTSTKKQARISAEVVLHGQDSVLQQGGFSEQQESTRAHATINLRGSTEQLRYRHVKGDVRNKPLFEQDLPAYFMVGYGATRRTEKAEHLDRQSEKNRGLRYQRVAGLFEDYISLRPLAATLLNSRRLEELYRLVNELLPTDMRFEGNFEQLEAVFVHRGIPLPFPALSDGYRAYVGLISDLLYHLASACPPRRKLKDTTGIVLIDDIDLHLHPCWQRTVITKLASTLPRLQFIVTSHSPLVAGNLYAENIRVVSTEPDATSSVSQFAEPIHGLNADQVLTSSYFNLPSTRAPDAVKQLEKLAGEAARRTNPDAGIEFLKQLTGKRQE